MFPNFEVARRKEQVDNEKGEANTNGHPSFTVLSSSSVCYLWEMCMRLIYMPVRPRRFKSWSSNKV